MGQSERERTSLQKNKNRGTYKPLLSVLVDQLAFLVSLGEMLSLRNSAGKKKKISNNLTYQQPEIS